MLQHRPEPTHAQQANGAPARPHSHREKPSSGGLAPRLFKVIRMGDKTRGEYQHDILSYIAARERHRAGEVSDEELARLRQLAVEARAAGIKSPPFE